jgi:hypothetical protein
MYARAVSAAAPIATYALSTASNAARQMTIQKVGTFVLGTLGILALDSMTKAEAGPAAEIACMAACSAAAFTPWGIAAYPACMTACVLVGLLPGP